MAVINIFEEGAKLSAPARRTADVRPQNGGALAVAQQNAQTINIAKDAGFKFQEQLQISDIMKANNEYNLRMNDLRNKLMENKEGNALENMYKFEEGRSKIVDEVIKNGPQSLRFGKAAQAFQASIDKDFVAQRDSMQRYVIGEAEKYNNTQYANQLNLCTKNAAENYLDQDRMNENMARAEAMAGARFFNYGDERIKLEADKAKGMLASVAIEASVNANNWDRAGELLQGYGKLLDPKVKFSFDKAITAQRLANRQLTTFEDVYKTYGKDLNGALKTIDGFDGAKLNLAAGDDYIKNNVGKHLGVNQCANFGSGYILAVGGDKGLTSSLADGMYLNFKNKGFAYEDRKELRDGDVVFYSNPNSEYAPTDDEAAVTDGSMRALRGITHVGVYDAKKGKVIQSGNSGVTYMDIDAMDVVCFGHVKGAEPTPVEREKRRQEYKTYYQNRERERRVQEDADFDNFSNGVLGWINNGVDYLAAKQNAISMAGMDADKQIKYTNMVNSLYRINDKLPVNTSDEEGTSGNSGNGGSTKGSGKAISEAALIDMLGAGKIESKEDLAMLIAEAGGGTAQYDKAIKIYNDFQNSDGIFKYNLNDMKKELLDGVDSKTLRKMTDGQKSAIWNEAIAGAKVKIQEYTMKNNERPSEWQVKNMLSESIIERRYTIDNSNYSYTDGKLARAGIDRIIPSGAGVDVYPIDKTKPVRHMSYDAFTERYGFNVNEE